MKKRGDFFSENIAGIVLAVLGIALIVFAIAGIYNTFVNQETENAKNILSNLETRINNLNDGETGRFTIRGIDGWFLTGWSKNDLNRPDKCFFESCLCVCKRDEGDAAKDCQKAGFCRGINKDEVKILEFHSVKDSQMKVNIESVIKDLDNPVYYGAGQWSDEAYNFFLLAECPNLKSNLFELLVYKDEKGLSVLIDQEIDFFNLEFTGVCIK